MVIQTSTIRPGLLVSLKTTIKGNCSYTKRTLEGGKILPNGEEFAAWETERTISDPAEYEAAKKIRAQARNKISGTCANSAFGLLCRQDRVDQLEIAIRDARQLCDEFNSTAGVTRIAVYVIAGRVAQDDAEAVRAVRSEIADLIAEMRQGVELCDVEKIREAANKARNVSQILSPGAAEVVADAIDAARKVARQLAKAGTEAVQAVDRSAVDLLNNAAASFVDMDGGAEVQAIDHTAPAVEFGAAPSLTEAAQQAAEIAAADIDLAPFGSSSAPVGLAIPPRAESSPDIEID